MNSVRTEINALLPSVFTQLSLEGVWNEMKHLSQKPVGELTAAERREILSRLEEPLQMKEFNIAPQLLAECKSRLGFVLHPRPLFVHESASRFLHIYRQEDVEWAHMELHAEAQSLGFSPRDCVNVGQVARELAENLVEHAGGGRLNFTVVEGEGEKGIQLIVEDEGPGIPADILEHAASFSHRNADGRLHGLAVARKYSHSFSIHGNVSRGTIVSCQFWPPQAPKR